MSLVLWILRNNNIKFIKLKIDSISIELKKRDEEREVSKRERRERGRMCDLLGIIH